ncbi:MAG: TIGR03792 family protein [Nostoc sp.]|uniref:TIGR03792 family protein n=1 Tax=Nostoc sp. TaxID=1180 RepID=UPI002FFC318B
MLIEQLKFKVGPNLRENFIQKDAQIWTIALVEYPRFLVKEVWISLNNHTAVIPMICWATLEHWKAIPQADLQTIMD